MSVSSAAMSVEHRVFALAIAEQGRIAAKPAARLDEDDALRRAAPRPEPPPCRQRRRRSRADRFRVSRLRYSPALVCRHSRRNRRRGFWTRALQHARHEPAHAAAARAEGDQVEPVACRAKRHRHAGRRCPSPAARTRGAKAGPRRERRAADLSGAGNARPPTRRSGPYRRQSPESRSRRAGRSGAAVRSMAGWPKPGAGLSRRMLMHDRLRRADIGDAAHGRFCLPRAVNHAASSLRWPCR